MTSDAIPKVIITSYYDGSTEGFVRSDILNSHFFFKLVAWDSQQDMRIFALKKIKMKVYLEIVNLLAESLASGKWKPIWLFLDDEKRAIAEKLLLNCRFESDIDFLVLGQNIDGKIKMVIPEQDVVNEVISLITRNKVDSIEKWLGLFIKVPETPFF